MKKSKYVVMDDGMFMWPARRADFETALEEGRDPWGDAAVMIPPELMPQIGAGVGTSECIDLCMALIDEGAEVYRPDQWGGAQDA